MKKMIYTLLGLSLIMNSMYCVSQEMKHEDTEYYEPVPSVITPGNQNSPPSDAIVLFDGTDLSQWQGKGDKPADWIVADGAMTVKNKAGDITTKQRFGDCQLHIEFRTPAEVKGKSQDRGNSGIFLMERYEVQVLDNYENPTYVNGQCGSIYKQHVPLVNVCRKPGEWQTYDIIFMAPKFDNEGKVLKPATFTVLQNGVLVQNHVEVLGPTVWIGHPKYEAHGAKEPIKLQDHGNPTSFRNIWIREL